MCISNPVPKREIRSQLPEAPATPPPALPASVPVPAVSAPVGSADKPTPVTEAVMASQQWLTGWKVLRRIKKGGKVILRSAMADDEWVPGLMVAKKPAAANFTGGKLPPGEYGFHVLAVRPPRPGPSEAVLRCFVHPDFISDIGKDSAAGANNVTTWVAKMIRVDQADYDAAIAGEDLVRTEKKAAAKKAVAIKPPSFVEATAAAKKAKVNTQKKFLSLARKNWKLPETVILKMWPKIKARLAVG